MLVDRVKYLIVGGGLASASAIEELMKTDPSASGATMLVCGEAPLPYHRPPLSKGYLLGSEGWEDVRVLDDDFYEKHGVAIHNQRRARLIDPASRSCELEYNRSVVFEKALIATGAMVNRWEGPGRALEGIHYLRTLGDSERLRASAENWNQVVLVGSGFISMELASALTTMGIKATILSRERLPWQRLENAEVSRFFKGYFEKKGVHFVLQDEPAALIGTAQVSEVHTAAGLRLPCDAVIFGIGVKPDLALAEASRLRTGDGIIVDSKLQTSQEGIYAAGDVACFEDPVFGITGRVEHWDNAQAQGQLAGRNLAGAGEPFDHLRMFFSDVFDLSWEMYGISSGADRIIQRGEVSGKNISSWYLNHGVITGALLMGRPAEESEAAAKLVKQKVQVTGKESILSNSSRSLEDLL